MPPLSRDDHWDGRAQSRPIITASRHYMAQSWRECSSAAACTAGCLHALSSQSLFQRQPVWRRASGMLIQRSSTASSFLTVWYLLSSKSRRPSPTLTLALALTLTLTLSPLTTRHSTSRPHPLRDPDPDPGPKPKPKPKPNLNTVGGLCQHRRARRHNRSQGRKGTESRALTRYQLSIVPPRYHGGMLQDTPQ